MTNIEYRKYREHILDHMDNDLEKLKSEVKRFKELPESNNTIWGAVDTMCQYGVFDVYYSDVLETLEDIYGSEFDKTKYIKKDGGLKTKNGETYCWKVYKAKISRAIEIMEKNGEI